MGMKTNTSSRGRSHVHGDADLVDRVLHGQREAYSELVRRYQDQLYRQARGMGIEHDCALDLVQDVLVRGYTQLARCREPGRFRVWIFRILRNRCLDHLKDIRRRTVSVDTLPLTDHRGDPDSHVERRQLEDHLRRALDSLPVEQREAFLMKHLQELTYPEMAKIVGHSESAMKMRVHRAREALSRSLAALSTSVTR
jgi:RNA polymerase sigma-70 factor, ECF subfamily